MIEFEALSIIWVLQSNFRIYRDNTTNGCLSFQYYKWMSILGFLSKHSDCYQVLSWNYIDFMCD